MNDKICIRGARENNLKNVDLTIPRDKLVVLTGLSGSGKSSLVNEILYKHLAKTLNRAKTRPGHFDEMLGVEKLDKIIAIDQSGSMMGPFTNHSMIVSKSEIASMIFAI